MYMKYLFFISTFFAFAFASSRYQLYINNDLPVFIKYYNGNTPPDSIASFINTYIQYKKITIVGRKELNKLFEENIQSLRGNNYAILESGINNYSEAINKPIARLFTIQLFTDKQSNSVYKIDSIRWQLKQFPDTDTTFRYTSFISDNKVDSTVYLVLKKFLDLSFQTGQKNK